MLPETREACLRAAGVPCCGEPSSGLEFQAVSWHCGDETRDAEDDFDDDDGDGDLPGGGQRERGAYVVRVFGVADDGRSVSLAVQGFTPFFYVRVPDALTRYVRNFERALEKACVELRIGLVEARAFHKTDFWGFTNGAQVPFVRLSFRTHKDMRRMVYKLKDGAHAARVRATGLAHDAQFLLYEANLDPMLRFFHIRDLQPAGWLRVPEGRFVRAPGAASGCQMDLSCAWTDVQRAAGRGEQVAPLVTAAFDIECNSSHGDFPVAVKDYRKLGLDLEAAWERGGLSMRPEYQAKEGLLACMRYALGIAEPPEADAPWIPRLVGRVHLKRPEEAPKAAGPVKAMVDDVYSVLRGLRVPRGGGDHMEDGGNDAAEDGSEASSVLGELVRVLNKGLARGWPVRGDEVIQIGTTVSVFGFDRQQGTDGCCARFVFTLGSCEPCSSGDVLTRAFEDEGEMLLAWAGLVRALDPDIMLGYNTFGFDMAYLYERACELMGGAKRAEARFCTFGRVPGQASKYVEQKLSSSALGDNVLRYLDMAGRVQVDLMKVVQRDHRLDSYKLDSVAAHFMGLNKHDISPKDIFRLQRGSAADRRVIAEYCVQDCALCNRLASKLDIVVNNMGMANVCSVPLSYLFMRGQGVKILSLVAKQCRSDGYLVPTFWRQQVLPGAAVDAAAEEEGYEGAVVLEPKTGMYLHTPVTVLDYNSLYPSSMISENISHDSLVLDPRYDNLPGVSYVTVRISETTQARFAQHGSGADKKAVLPRILQQLLAARKATRARMAHVRVRLDGGAGELVGLLDRAGGVLRPADAGAAALQLSAAEASSARPAYDAFQSAVLDGLQLAYKVTANSLYGQMGARTSALYLKQVAAATTAVGRQMIMTAKEFVEGPEVGGRVVYGDSVAGYTPVLVRDRKTGTVSYHAIEALAHTWGRGQWVECAGGKEEACEMRSGQLDTWTEQGWTPVLRVVRHLLAPGKRMLRVATPAGAVDVTDDHSLVLADGSTTVSPAAPGLVGSFLLDAPLPPLTHTPRVQDVVRRLSKLAKADAVARVLLGCHTEAAIWYEAARHLGLEAEVDTAPPASELPAGGGEPPMLVFRQRGAGFEAQVRAVTELAPQRGAYVYDLTTSNHHFAAGVGRLVVHNTDSIFVVFPDPPAGTSSRDTLAASIRQGQQVSRGIKPLLRAPHNLEYEKTMFPLILLAKKRYVGLLYEDDPDGKPKQKSMGIALKRRDYAPIVKKIYGGIIDIMLRERDIPAAVAFLQRSLRDLAAGRFDLEDLIISKTLRAHYKIPHQIPHWVLARRMYERDPGSAPQANDRVPYVFVETSKKDALMGDRIEHADYVRKAAGGAMRVDTKTYISNQIMKPCVQLLGIALEQLPGYRRNPDCESANLQALVLAKGGDAKKARERFDTLREREVERLLFEPVLQLPVFRQRDNRCAGQREITSFYSTKRSRGADNGQ